MEWRLRPDFDAEIRGGNSNRSSRAFPRAPARRRARITAPARVLVAHAPGVRCRAHARCARGTMTRTGGHAAARPCQGTARPGTVPFSARPPALMPKWNKTHDFWHMPHGGRPWSTTPIAADHPRKPRMELLIVTAISALVVGSWRMVRRGGRA